MRRGCEWNFTEDGGEVFSFQFLDGEIINFDFHEILLCRFGKDYARTTVVTFIQRLAEKGFVNTYKKGRVSYVHSLRSQSQYQENFLQKAEEFWFDGDAGFLFSTLCKVKKLSKKEVDDIQKMLDELDN